MTARKRSAGSAQRSTRQRASRTSTAKSAKRPAAKRQAAKRPSAKAGTAARGSKRSGVLLRAAVIAALTGAGLFFVIYPMGTLFDQHAELDELRSRQAEIAEEIAEVEGQIDSLSGPEGIELRARCFAHYVRPGTETYQVPGRSGCAEHP